MFHLSFFGSVVEAAEFFLGGGGENVTQKIYILKKGSEVDQNLTF
jgi:hypothetical protein